MEMLIKGLLAYTRATTAEDEPREPTDARMVVRKVLQDMQSTITEYGATITFGELPTLNVNEVHLRQLFQNLISNAIKYHGNVAPRVHISATCNSPWLFSVTDNGIGIEPQYFRQIFGIFKRLHNADQYSGTGIGLAVCQKIVDRYGGKIWVESEPGKGSTFRFTLPDSGEVR
jgi:light-regulated signal transduction histidine kinase (bacteriophytochrome)